MEETTLSSILKALKKVENVPPPEQGENDLRDRISRSVPSPGPTRDKRPLLLAAGILVVLVAVFLSSRFASHQKPAPAMIEAVPNAGTAPRPPELSKPEEAPVPAAESTILKAPPPATRPPRIIPEGNRKPVPLKPVKPLPRPVIQDLILEGIVWSEAPESRFAMIDGQIVRQGGTIQGVRVIRIAEDHVLVQSRDGKTKERLTVR